MPATRQQRVAAIQQLRARGFTNNQISQELRISKSTVAGYIYDPTGEKARVRKDRYRGRCKVCGAATTGTRGRDKAPKYCAKHAPRFTYWTESKIVAAIHEFHYVYGRLPTVMDWLGKVEGSPGQYATGPRSESVGKRRWPPVRTVQEIFGSWSAAIEAAGFPRPMRGYYHDESKRHKPKKWTEEKIIEWLKRHAEGGVAPSTSGVPIYKSARRVFGSWDAAVLAAGLKPRRAIVRSTD